MCETLILYYSFFFDHPKKFARILQKNTGFALERIRDRDIPFFSLLATLLHFSKIHGSPILPIQHDIAGSSRIILIIPVISQSPAPAIRRFFAEYDLTGKEVCCIFTHRKNPGKVQEKVKELITSAGGKCLSASFLNMTPEFVGNMNSCRFCWQVTEEGQLVQTDAQNASRPNEPNGTLETQPNGQE